MTTRLVVTITTLSLAVSHVAQACQLDLAPQVINSPFPGGGFEFGRSTAAADFDGDGFDDLVVLESGATVDGLVAAGRVWILSGPSLQPSLSFHARAPVKQEYLGSGGCWIGDVNGDGALDMLLGSYQMKVGTSTDVGRAHLFLGPDFRHEIVFDPPIIQAEEFFGFRGLLEDFDGDGLDDVLLSANHADAPAPGGTPIVGAGQVFHWNARDVLDPAGPGRPAILTDPQPHPNGAFGSTLYVADVDGRSPVDLFVSAYLTTCCPFSGGQVDIFKGLGPELIDTAGLGVVPGGDGVGSDIQLADVTGDGIADLVLGAPMTDGGCAASGLVLVLGGPGFDQVAFTIAPPRACTGKHAYFGAIARVDDVDRDGHPDLVCSDGSSGNAFDPPALVDVFWGPTYATHDSLGDEFLPVNPVGFGLAVTLGDFDGDGFDELAISASQGNGSGTVYVYDPKTLLADTSELSVGAGGDVHFALRMAPEEAGKMYVAGLGVSGSMPGVTLGPGSYVPLNPDSVTFASLGLLASPLFPGFVGELDDDAKATFAMHAPPGFPAMLIGLTLTVAAVVVQPDGRFGPGSSAASVQIAP